MINPKASIINVTFNDEKVLERTLKSIESLNYDNLEVLVIDGASTDSTLDIVRRYSNIVTKWISEPDRGLYDAMNKGLRMASGDYVWFLNAGDSVHYGRVLHHFFDKEFVARDIYYGDTLIVDNEGKKIGSRRLRPKSDLRWRDFHWGMLVCHQSIIVKRAIAPEYDLQYTIDADYDWMIKCFKKAEYILFTKHHISAFLAGGLSRKKMLKANCQRFKIMKKHYGLFSALWYNFLMCFRFIFTVAKVGHI